MTIVGIAFNCDPLNKLFKVKIYGNELLLDVGQEAAIKQTNQGRISVWSVSAQLTGVSIKLLFYPFNKRKFL